MRIEALSTVVAALESGKRPKGGATGETGTIPSLGGEHLNNDGGFRFDNIKYIEEHFFAALKKGTIKQNDILIVKDGATTGKVSYVGADFPFQKAAINEHLFSLTVNTKIANPRYVFSFLKSPQGQQEILKDFRGAAIGGISRGFVDIAKIPLPSLNDQIRIAHLLGKVEGLIAKRKQHLQQLDDLLKSVFLEMFGDPVQNEKGWDTTPFHKIGKFVSGGTPSKSRDDFWIGSYPWVSPKDMKVSKIADAIDHISELVFEETTLKRIAPHHLLIVVRGMILAHSFPVAINTTEIAINQDMKAIKPAKGVNVVYLQHCLTALKRKVLKLISTAGHGTRKFDSDAMQKLFVPKPPEELQSKFVVIANKIDALKSRYQKNLTDLESLYGTLSQKAFKGELDISRVPLPGSKDRTNEVAEISANSMQAFKSSERVISQLNNFNSQHAVFLDALNSMPALKIANSPVFKAARELSEQAALWRTPLDQFRNMGTIAKATAAIATASNIAGVNSAALLAQQIASTIPKMDMAWLKDQQAIINAAVGPFSEMRQAIAALQLPDPVARLTKSESAVSAIQAAVSPDNAAVLALTIQQDDNENEPRYIFTRDDILQVLSEGQPLSVIDLMSNLAELEPITPQGYDRIKNLVFSLLAEDQIQQQYNDEENAIAFRRNA